MNETLSHKEAFELLPWYVNDTLPESERSAVRAHLGSCLVCRRELGFLERLGEGVAGSASLDFAPQRAFGSLLERIDASEASFDRRAWLRIAAGLEALRAAHPALRGTLLVQSALILIAAVLLLRAPLPDRAPRFETLSDAPALGIADPAAARLRVVFAPDAPVSHVSALLYSAGARVVGGPSSAGVYTIDVPAAASGPVLERLRADGQVRFAESVTAETSQ